VELKASALERDGGSARIGILWAIGLTAARKQGLRFGVTVHQARNWWWFQTAHGADKNR
jgi:hypothetical protein